MSRESAENIIIADVLHPGWVRAELLVLDESLSFWGGFDPQSGAILDRHHPQAGQVVTAKVIAMPSSRGSAGTPAGVAESIRKRSGPVAVILGKRDVNITIGAMVAGYLYDLNRPVLVVEESDYDKLVSGQIVEISADGTIRIE